jgi:cytoskeletal protein CcmA (bactofilin family)
VLDGRHASADSNLTGLERAKLERSLHGDEPQPAPEPAPSKPVVAVAIPQRKSAPPPQPMPAIGSAAHLHAGPGIKLKGEISGCDTLRVEGIVDGNAQARQLILCAGGSFIGAAEIDEAEIEGKFDGTLTVHGRLLLRNTGRIDGTLSYGQIEIERGGEIAGQITPHGKQIVSPQRSRSEAAFVPVPSERRSAPKPVPHTLVQTPVQMPRPASRAEETAAAAAEPAKPNPPMPLEQPAAARPAPESQAKRKVLFFGRG